VADDDNLELKKRARRRLVGAAALALLAAIVLPMVMDQEPRPLNQDVQIQIPRQEGDNFTARPIAPPAAVANPDTPAEPESPGSTPPLRPVPAPAAETAKPPAGKPEAPKPDAVKAEAPKAEPPKPAPPKTEPPKAEAPRAEPPKAEAGRAEALLGGQAEETYVVQLGAYKDETNVASLRDKLKTEGFTAYTEKVADKTRVRVGPYPNRDAADKAAERLRKIGLNGVVTVR
jgi:DedD protein